MAGEFSVIRPSPGESKEWRRCGSGSVSRPATLHDRGAGTAAARHHADQCARPSRSSPMTVPPWGRVASWVGPAGVRPLRHCAPLGSPASCSRRGAGLAHRAGPHGGARSPRPGRGSCRPAGGRLAFGPARLAARPPGRERQKERSPRAGAAEAAPSGSRHPRHRVPTPPARWRCSPPHRCWDGRASIPRGAGSASAAPR